MPVEHDILPFLEWLLPSVPHGTGALLAFFIACCVLILVACLFAYVVSAARYGPGEAFYVVAKVIANALSDDAPNFSLRRTGAIARLAIQESIRRRVLVAFVVFVIVLLFAGLFLDVESDNPARLYLGFVLTTANYMMFVLAIFLSTFSLPNDIKNKTIYTVVTKPVRAFEIVLGRVVGFSVIGTALLAVMGVSSYVFVVRGLAHTHKIEHEDVQSTGAPESDPQGVAYVGKTSSDSYHRHSVTIFNDGRGQTDIQRGHWHPVTWDKANNKFIVGPHQGMLIARVPIHGDLRFLDRQGHVQSKGVNVGHEWEYRSYIEGQTQARAIWTFHNIVAADYPSGIPLELNLRVFRTYKGDIKKGIPGEIEVHNLDPKAKYVRSIPIPFTATEFVRQELPIPVELNAIDRTGSVKKVQLKDLIHEGELELRVKCSQPAQYYGMAKADLFIRSEDRAFSQNFIKGYTSVWLQLMMVSAFGVMFSTFLSAPVALLATISSIVLGFFGKFISELITGDAQGGGPVESVVRLLGQYNLSSDLELGRVVESIIKGLDWFLLEVVQIFAQLLPNYRNFDTSAFVSYGYNITGNIVAQQSLMAMACMSVVTVVGYFFLKTREIGA